jgi:hypothetical protein
MAQAINGSYRGNFNCAKLPFTAGSLRTETISITVSGSSAQYSRSVYSADGKSITGQESGSGTVAPDGAISLSGGWSSGNYSFTARYSGKLSERSGTLKGAQNWTVQGKSYPARSCSMTVKS